MGFETTRFVNLSQSLSEELSCSICLNIFDSPITSFKGNCDHTFCKQCVQQWINTNKSKCPACQQSFTKKRNINDNNCVIIGYVFKTNRIVNNIVNKLKIHCNYKWNGCEEVVELGSLQKHLNECAFSLCKTCDMTLGSVDDHNCIQLLTKDRNDWKIKSNEMKVKNSKLSKRMKKWKQKYLKCDQTLKEVINENLKFKTNISHYSFYPRSVSLGLMISNINNWVIHFNSSLELINWSSEQTIYIDYKSINELMHYSDSSESMLFIRVDTQSCIGFRNQLKFCDQEFDVDSNGIHL